MTQQKQKILISAFSCMPNMGSEPGVGWHWVLEMSKYFELWVLVHKEQVSDIEQYVKDNGIDDKIHFIYLDIPFNSLFFKNGIFRWVRLYYYFWTILSNKIVKKTMEENDIKIFHHLTFGNAIWNVSKYGRKQFFIWGPVGGVETISKEYSSHYSLKSKLLESVRRNMVKIITSLPSFKKRCKDANLILCKTNIMQQAVPEEYRDKAILFTDVAVDVVDVKSDSQSGSDKNGKVNFISVGRLDAWRGFDLLVESFAIALQKNPNMHLSILGEGVDRSRIESLISKLNIEQDVTLVGSVKKTDYDKMLSESDVVVNSCLKEGAVTVSFDCMRYGKPLICIDSGGFTQYFSSDYAIVLPQDSRMNTINSMTDSFIHLMDANRRATMGQHAKEVGNQFSWQYKGEQIRDAINAAIEENKL